MILSHVAVHDGGGSSRKEEDGDERDLESFINSPEDKAVYETVQSFFVRPQHWRV